MPLVRFEVVEGRNDNEIKRLLEAAHRVMLSTFHVPESDRYQIYHEHPLSHLVAEDTGLGIRRTRNLVFESVTSRERTQEMKEKFYAELCRELKRAAPLIQVMSSSLSSRTPQRTGASATAGHNSSPVNYDVFWLSTH